MQLPKVIDRINGTEVFETRTVLQGGVPVVINAHDFDPAVHSEVPKAKPAEPAVDDDEGEDDDTVDEDPPAAAKGKGKGKK